MGTSGTNLFALLWSLSSLCLADWCVCPFFLWVNQILLNCGDWHFGLWVREWTVSWVGLAFFFFFSSCYSPSAPVSHPSNLTEAETAHKAIFCYFKHETQLFKVLLSLKVVKFDIKMYLDFSNFRGRTSAGGGDKPWSKNGDKCRMGGDWQNFRRMGGPPVPPGKNPGLGHVFWEELDLP